MTKVRTIICSVIMFIVAFYYFSHNPKDTIVSTGEPKIPITKTVHIKTTPSNISKETLPLVVSKDYYAEMGDHTFSLNLPTNELDGTLLVIIAGIKIDLNIIGGVGMVEIDGHVLQARLERLSADTVLARINLSGEMIDRPSNFAVELLELGIFNQNKKAAEDSAYDLSLSYPNDESFVEYQDQMYQDEGVEMQAAAETNDTASNPFSAENFTDQTNQMDWNAQLNTAEETFNLQSSPDFDQESYPQAFHNFNEGIDEYQN